MPSFAAGAEGVSGSSLRDRVEMVLRHGPTSLRSVEQMPGADVLKNMVELPGGRFRMGSDRFYPEEAPAREVSVDGFWIDRHPVTVGEFRRFVKATGHVTWAEKAPEADDYPDADPELLVPGSLVFDKTPATGGPGRPEPTGATRKAPKATSAAGNVTRSPTSPTPMPRPTPTGPASRCPTRPSGSTPPGAAWTARSSPGATSSPRKAA
jgi:formylglycine-generating enzyme required for sulfatase activity